LRHELTDWITIAEAAEFVRRTARAMRYWTAGIPPKVPAIVDAHGVRRVLVRDLIDHDRDLRQRRAARPT